MAAQQKQRSQGGGRTKNSEPKVQTFTGFGGCNFELSPRKLNFGEFPHQPNQDPEQTDLQMNYMVIQNNASIASNKTIEARDSFEFLGGINDSDSQFLGPVQMIGRYLYVATKKEGATKIRRYDINDLDGKWHSDIISDEIDDLTDIAYADGKLIALTASNKLYFGSVDDDGLCNSIEPPVRVDDPEEPLRIYEPPEDGAATLLDYAFGVQPMGNLAIDTKQTEDCVHRIMIAYAYVNEVGPTKISPNFTFYANIPLDEWHAGQYLAIHIPRAEGSTAVELFYAEDNANSLLFFQRGDLNRMLGVTVNWVGYLTDTSMWTTSNLLAPKRNYTEGPSASRLTVIDGRIYFWGDNQDPQRLWIGGNPGSMLSVSSGTGGGFVDVDPGSGQQIRYVEKYKTQSGNSIVTLLTDSKNSTQERRYNLIENTVSLASEQSMKSWSVEQVAGSVGCKSFNGGLVCEDGLYAVSRYGLSLTTQTMEYNSQIRATYVSDPIKPIFTGRAGRMLANATLIDINGVIYLAFGNEDEDGLEHIIFCYDIDQKAWWTYDLSMEVKWLEERYGKKQSIKNIFRVDYEGQSEGIGIIFNNVILLIPTTQVRELEDDDFDEPYWVPFRIESGELSTAIPLNSMSHITQMEFHFDYFVGQMQIDFVCIDQFGRLITTTKIIEHESEMLNLTEYMRIDLRVRSYKIRMTGKGKFRLTHFLSKLYTLPNKVGIMWGFDDSQSFREANDIHPYFKDYNDVINAIIP